MRNIAVGLAWPLFVVAPAYSQLQPNQVPESIRTEMSAFETAILQNAGRAIPGQSINWSSSTGQAGIARFQPEFSAKGEPGVECGACIDPCRRFTTTYRSTIGQGEFRGVACYLAGDNGYRITDLRQDAWLPASPAAAPTALPPPPTIIVQRLPAPSTPAPLSSGEFLAQLSGPFAALGYRYATPQEAFAAYVRDYGLPLSMNVVAGATRSEQLAMIEAAKQRAGRDGKQTATVCPALEGRPVGSQFGACR